ncbi:hypothetical protein GCM10023191_030390 [Actinoallomurus oryzae]|uniref:Uncharacterized protein n=2 Tax=Actinoallomurus oryzae TaxID=502180 RepID=A0ABP8PVK9_9ACTN
MLMVGQTCPLLVVHEAKRTRILIEIVNDEEIATPFPRPHGIQARLASSDEGVPADVLSRVLLIEFGTDEPAFEALDPAGYIVHGQAVPIRSAGPSLR